MDILRRILVACLIFAYAYAGQCGVYKFASVNTALVGPDSHKTKILMNFDLNVLQVKEILNTAEQFVDLEVLISLQNLNISVQKENAEIINLSDCPSFKTTMQELGETYHMVQQNGLVQYIQIPKKHTDRLAVNLKFLLGEIMEANVAKLSGINSPYGTRNQEDTIFGVCDVVYNPRNARDSQIPGTSNKNNNITIEYTFEINKVFDMTSCTKINNPIDSTSPLLQICNPQNQKHFQMNFNENMTLTVFSNLSKSTKSLNLVQNVFYNPWIDSPSSKVTQTIRATVKREPNNIECDLQFDFTPENIRRIIGLNYSPVDQSLFKRNGSDPLVTTYKGLACDPYNSNIYLDIYGHALTCSKQETST